MLSGYKTYITGALAIIIGIAGMTGLLPAGVTADPALMLTTGFGLIFLRNGINTAAAGK